jgi:hypothetical protein
MTPLILENNFILPSSITLFIQFIRDIRMKRLIPILTLVVVFAYNATSQVSVSRAYNVPATDTLLSGLNSIRGANVGNDIDGDGKMEIVVTNYAYSGHVHVFEVVGDNTLELVWSSPTLTSGGGGSTPRYVLFGDMDNDGKGEVIYQSSNNGIFIYEWDGVTGSDNYGTSPSGTIGSSFFVGTGGSAEFIVVDDVDGDSQNELLIAYNSSPNSSDGYYIFSATGDWNTNDPGFASFTKEYEGIRTDLGAWGLSGGSPYGIFSAQFDGTGNKEILIHNWNNKNVVPMTVPSANTYQIGDTTNGKQSRMLMSSDKVALFGSTVTDIDNDGREELYLPTYSATSLVHMISYDGSENTSEIDSFNVTDIEFSALTGGSNISMFGAGYGDIDGDGKREIYTSTVYPYNLIALEYQGGGKRDPANWTSEILYAGESDMYSAMTIKDSLGVIDTSYTVQDAFAGKLVARNFDLDGDSKQDIVLPYQATNDSIAVTTLIWNATNTVYDTTSSKIENPKNWGFRVVEGSATSTSVELNEWSVITPDDYQLDQNYPNPFNPSTTIRFTLPIQQTISLKIYDINGRLVRSLLNSENYAAGSAEVVWDGLSAAGQTVASGTYFYTLSWGNFAKTMKMSLLK